MRAATACEACRSFKRKCRFESNISTACKSCSLRGLVCSGPKTTSQQSNIPFSALRNNGSEKWDTQHSSLRPQGRSPEIAALPHSVCQHLVDIYFDVIHDQFHSLFHPPSFRRDLIAGHIPEVVLLGIAALAARFSDHPYFADVSRRERGRGYAERAKTLLCLDDVSLSSLRACVLIGTHANTEGNARGGSVYYSAAIRMAELLRLPHCPDSSLLEYEINVRTLWTLYMLDTWAAYGLRTEKRFQKPETLPMPMEETAFWELGGDIPDMQCVPEDARPSLLAQMAQLNLILAEILSLDVLSTSQSLTETELINRVDHVSLELRSWKLSQSPSMELNLDNLTWYASKGLGRMFLAVYLGYYNFGLLLFYRFLSEERRTVPKFHHYAENCTSFAISLCEAIYLANSIPGCEARYMMVGHLLAVASTVHIHTLLSSSDTLETARAKQRLERNFELIYTLKNFWPALDITFQRFNDFHDLCQRAGESSFEVNDGILRFLMEFANSESPSTPY